METEKQAVARRKRQAREKTDPGLRDQIKSRRIRKKAEAVWNNPHVHETTQKTLS